MCADMKSAFDFAKYFIKNGFNKCTYDGNMKLQKLLTFAFLIHLANTGKQLYNEDILAYRNGCVIEPVRLRYKNEYESFLKESNDFNPNFDANENYTLDITKSIFGDVSPRELSKINHTFDFWKNAYERSDKGDNIFRDKSKVKISMESIKNELPRINKMVEAYKQNETNKKNSDQINGINFHFDSSIDITDELIDFLEKFSITAEDTDYTVYKNDGDLVIY